MRKQLPGGTAPFQIEPKPNVIQKAPYQETIDRLGEKILFLRNLPTPDVTPGRLATPDARADGKGYIYSYQKTARQETEEASLMGSRSINRVYTRNAPISKVRKLVWRRGPLQGGDMELTVTKFTEEYIEFSENIPYYASLAIDYDVRLYETVTLDIAMARDGRALDLSNGSDLIHDVNGNIINVCVKVHEVWLINEDGTLTKLDNHTHDFTHIYLEKTYGTGVSFRVTLDRYDTINAAYHTFDNKTQQIGQSELPAGAIQILFNQWVIVSPGDILIFTNAFQNTKEVSARGTDGRYPLIQSPVREIEAIFYLRGNERVEVDPESVSIENFRYMRLPEDITPSRVSVVYNYHPQYRVHPEVQLSSHAYRQQPRKWTAIPAQTNIILE